MGDFFTKDNPWFQSFIFNSKGIFLNWLKIKKESMIALVLHESGIEISSMDPLFYFLIGFLCVVYMEFTRDKGSDKFLEFHESLVFMLFWPYFMFYYIKIKIFK